MLGRDFMDDETIGIGVEFDAYELDRCRKGSISCWQIIVRIRWRLNGMHIGLIGGIGPAATDFYYRRLITAFAGRQAPLDLTIVHADTPILLGNLANNDTAAQVAIYSRLTNRLVAAGAGCVVITSISGHFCIDAFKAVSRLPVVDMISEVNAEAIMLGGTDLALAFDAKTANFPLVDCAGIHVDAIVRRAIP